VQDRARGGGWETARVFLTAEPDTLATAKASMWASADGRTQRVLAAVLLAACIGLAWWISKQGS
jgi:hypothetical protein